MPAAVWQVLIDDEQVRPSAVEMFLCRLQIRGAVHVRRAMQAGAVGFISKSASEQQMCASLERILRGDAPLEELPASGSRPQSDGVHARGENAELTPRQRQVLELICAGESNKRIARRLGLTVGTVKLHVCAILQALDVESRTQAAVKAHNMGYAPPPMN